MEGNSSRGNISKLKPPPVRPTIRPYCQYKHLINKTVSSIRPSYMT